MSPAKVIDPLAAGGGDQDCQRAGGRFFQTCSQIQSAHTGKVDVDEGNLRGFVVPIAKVVQRFFGRAERLGVKATAAEQTLKCVTRDVFIFNDEHRPVRLLPEVIHTRAAHAGRDCNEDAM